MKTLASILVIVLSLAVSTNIFAQTKASSKTESIKVWGNCESCKARIEGALKVDGISKADWNEKTQMLKVTYNPAKITNDAIQKRIAAVGHDTEKYKADNKVYAKLPGCCKYERKK
ncbi:MAG: cation transporter [Bacteroidota bacterium]|nr:cation transporter [Bacteroidota bacterium]